MAQDINSLQANPLSEQLDALERHGYRPVERTTPNELESVRSLIRENAGATTLNECDFSVPIESDDQSRSIGNYDQVIDEMLPFVLQNYSPECVANLLAHYMAEKLKHPNSIDKDAACRTPETDNAGEVDLGNGYPDIMCPRVLQEREIYLRVSNTLTEALFTPTREVGLCRNGPNRINGFEELSRLISQIGENQQQIEECTEVQVGETVPRKNKAFSLTRNSENDYTANLVIDFSIFEGATSSLSPQDMRQRLEMCVAGVNQLFRSSNGQSLNFNILSPQDQAELSNAEKLEVHNIKYQSAEFRENSYAYRDSSDCQTMSHELFHLLGLLDEYHENGEDSGFYYTDNKLMVAKNDSNYQAALANGTLNFAPVNNSCRSIPTTPSIMASDRKAFRRSAAIPIHCQCQDDYCRGIIDLKSPQITLMYGAEFDFPEFKEVCGYDSDLTTNGYRADSINTDLNTMTDEERQQLEHYKVVSSTANQIIIRRNSIPDFNSNTGLYEPFSPSYYRCSCDTGEVENCASKLEKVRNADFSDYFTPTCKNAHGAETNQQVNLEDTIPRSDVDSVAVEISENSFSIIAPPSEPGAPMLHPAHMTFIKFPGCRSRASKYRTCQTFAYVNDCPDRPSYCDEEEQWLMQEQ